MYRQAHIIRNLGERRRTMRRRNLSRQMSKSLTGMGAAVVLVGIAALSDVSGRGNQAVDPIELSSVARNGSKAAPEPVITAAMPVCGMGRRVTCIVDGDTFWLEGVKYRIANIDTPELKGRCKAEKAIAIRARNRLEQLMSGEPVTLSSTGTDPHGRTLVLVSGSGGDLGETLVSEGLAEVWGGAFIDWCRG